ncbi:MAG: acyl-CoA dehydrogenase family protein, partial [Actinomycetota bacterium]|nr:acyl-CoA dehydrogenase family protein [Actinomycetota bacterium]
MSGTGRRPGREQLDAFRGRVRAHIAEHAPASVAREGRRAPESADQEAALRTWFVGLFDAGFVGADWPVEYGGRPDHHPLHDRIVSEEILRARAPRPVDQVNLAAHVLLHFGSEEQKADLLPPIRSSEHVWCQLLSEPDAGSDIAGVRCRGVRNDDGSWVLDGQKTWITDGHWADMGLALIRTDPASSRHHGLSAFVVPLSAPGVEVRPIRTINDAIEVNEVFLDSVHIPADGLIGQPGQGWSIIMAGLDFERFGIGGNVIL